MFQGSKVEVLAEGSQSRGLHEHLGKTAWEVVYGEGNHAVEIGRHNIVEAATDERQLGNARTACAIHDGRKAAFNDELRERLARR